MVIKRKKDTAIDFCEGDLVAVFGGLVGKEDQSANQVVLCDVLIVGMTDLIVEDREARYGQTHHLVPKSICTKLDLDPSALTSSPTLEPEIGDLVLSYSRGYSSETPAMTTGVLYSIAYRLGKPEKCTLLCGTDMIEVKHVDLIVLDRT